MRYLNNKPIPPEIRGLKKGCGDDPFSVPIGVGGVYPYYGCSGGYNGPIIAWSEGPDNHNVDIIVARLNQDNADNAIASGEDQRLALGNPGN